MLQGPAASSSSAAPQSQQHLIPQQYLSYIHSNALRVVSGNAPLPWSGPLEIHVARAIAKEAVTAAGLHWGPLFEADLNTLAGNSPPRGVIYDIETIEYVFAPCPCYLAALANDYYHAL